MKTAVIYDKWLSGLGGGEVVACTVARTLKDAGYDVLFLTKDLIPADKIKDKLGIDVSGITIKQVSEEQDLKKNRPDLFINISFMDYSYGIGKKNVYYVHFPSAIRSGVFNYILRLFEITNFHRYLPKILKEKVDDRLRAGVYPDMKKRLDSYDTFICHSEFVKGWIKKLWRKEAIVLYPPVKLITSPKPLIAKLNWITSVGRFFTLGHGKKQEVLIEAFKKLINSSTSTDLQLHLIGGVGSEPSSLRYVEHLKQMAKGYPVFFHFNAKREEVEEILLKSKVYWHAGGYEETNPINLEHFGIAPVEAISAGCIPILFNGGGLPEIIEKLEMDKDKFLFNTMEELVIKTQNVINTETNHSQDNVYRLLDKTFSSSRFISSLYKLL